ncbi:hypothetical protein Tco_0867900 [Tanacetum coccineum]
MHFLLFSMSVVYVLTTPILEDDGDDATIEQIRKRAKWDNDDYVCRGLILNDASSKKFLVSNFTNYKMTDSRPVLEQYNKLLGILGRFTQYKMNMNEVIQVFCIIDKLPPSWKDFMHTLKHLKEELTLVELSSHLRIEESLKVQDSDKPKHNNVDGPSVVNMVEHNNSSKYNDNKGKRKHHDNTRSDPNKKAKPTCTKGSVDGSSNSLKGHNMFNKSLQVYYVTYVSEAYFVQDDDVAWWVDLGATIQVLKIKILFKTYEVSLNDGSIIHMGNESTALVHGSGCVDLRSIRYKGKDTLGFVILGVILHKDLLTLSDPYSAMTLFGGVTDWYLEPRFQWVSDDELEAHEEVPQFLEQAPPSPAYVPGLEHPPSPDYVPGPEHPPSPDYVPGPEYPEYLVPSDDEVPIEDQPLPTDASLTTLSPGYVADFDPSEEDPEGNPEEDPEEDPAEYPANRRGDDDDDGEDDEEDEEEDEHLALADSTTLHAIDPVDMCRSEVTIPSSSTPQFPEIVALADAVKALVLLRSRPLASVKAVEEICFTCGGLYPYYQCLAIDGNVFPEYRDNIQGYVSTAAVNYNQANTGYRPQGVANQI